MFIIFIAGGVQVTREFEINPRHASVRISGNLAETVTCDFPKKKEWSLLDCRLHVSL